jgi:hypothetical protein
MAKSNGGIIGALNPTSFGKCTVTSQTSSGTLTTQPGTRLVSYAVSSSWWWWRCKRKMRILDQEEEEEQVDFRTSTCESQFQFVEQQVIQLQ